MNKFILSIDQGTTGTTAVLINSSDYSMVDKVNHEFPQIFPKPGWVEHDLNNIWKTVEDTICELFSKNSVTSEQIECIGITNQRETTCAFDKNGAPLCNAIVWQDRRTSQMCQKIQGRKRKYFIKKTGLPVDPYFSATKMKWLLENNSTVARAAQDGSLHFGTIDTFLLFKLSGNQSFKTESSNASRTLLMNIKTSDWDKDLLKIFNIDRNFLPDICDSFGIFGTTKGLNFLPDGIPITGILGDQQAALFGQSGISKGSIKCTYGTGAFVLLNTGKQIQYSKNGLLTTVAYRYAGMTRYALEGSSYIAGAAVQWLRDNLNLIASSPEVEELAKNIDHIDQMEHLLFLPFFSGLASPYWIPEGKGAIVGITRDTGKTHIARACLEGICLAINDLIQAMKDDCKFELNELKVDGGACANNLLMEMQSSITSRKIIRPKIIETTAYGAALGAAIGNDRLTFKRIESFWSADRSFEPTPEDEPYFNKKKDLWKIFIKRLYL